MPTTLTVRTRNQVSTPNDVPYVGNNGEFITVDLIEDYLIWTKDDDPIVTDHMTAEPKEDELNNAAPVIDEADPVKIPMLLLMDNSGNIQGSYFTHKVLGMGENKRYVFCFSFDGATAMIPRLEAWDTSEHSTADNIVLGGGTPANSMVKAIRTTSSLPGDDWAGTPIAGAANYVELDTAALSGAKDLYANIKIVLPAGAPNGFSETPVLTIRFTSF